MEPNLGLQYENLEANVQNKIKVEDTGGLGFLIAGGLETNIKKISMGFNLQFPLTQNYSNHQTKSGWRDMMHITYNF